MGRRGHGIVERVGAGVKPKRGDEWYCWKTRLLVALLLLHVLIPYTRNVANANDHHKFPK